MCLGKYCLQSEEVFAIENHECLGNEDCIKYWNRGKLPGVPDLTPQLSIVVYSEYWTKHEAYEILVIWFVLIGRTGWMICFVNPPLTTLTEYISLRYFWIDKCLKFLRVFSNFKWFLIQVKKFLVYYLAIMKSRLIGNFINDDKEVFQFLIVLIEEQLKIAFFFRSKFYHLFSVSHCFWIHNCRDDIYFNFINCNIQFIIIFPLSIYFCYWVISQNSCLYFE